MDTAQQDRDETAEEAEGAAGSPEDADHRRFHRQHDHLAPVFGPSWFGEKAERFARFFGTPTFLIGQTLVVSGWIVFNSLTGRPFDPYPYILLNLAFSLQAAYAAPLILLAQTRQADRDKALADADARHREALAAASSERQALAERQSEQLIKLLEQNTELTRITHELTARVEELTREIHGKVC